jgi:saccharopine dehydrogenase (NADP+, L-glutamate forming)
MNPILILGAGRSSVSLLTYLDKLASIEKFRFSVADADPQNLAIRTSGLHMADSMKFEGNGPEDFLKIIQGHKIVISLLPPPIHPQVAKACLMAKANLITASYESDEMRQMAKDVEDSGLVFFNECGLDPGIDHMSAMEMIEEIQNAGGKIERFHSYCGGLVADEFDDNPFRYKISWNPRNVVLAGKTGGLFLENNRETFLPYQRLFSETETISIPGWGEFEAYPNRDSVPYKKVYGLEGILDLKRGTLRKPGFSKRWDVFVRSGMTDELVDLTYPDGSSYADFLRTFFPSSDPGAALRKFVGHENVANDILAMFQNGSDSRMLKRTKGKPADFLLDLIVECWPLGGRDKDLVVMLHDFYFFDENGDRKRTFASFGLKGEDSLHTAMAKTVGLPLGIVSKLLLKGSIPQKGLALPLNSDVYKPVLEELSTLGVQFQKTTMPL